MKVDLNNRNEAMVSLINDYIQILPLDANILIPPDRSKVVKNADVPFDWYKKFWLDPLFKTFPYLAIHQAVHDEVTITASLANYLNEKIQQQNLLILKDDDLSETENIIRRTIELKIAGPTNYDPEIDNRDDRGEVKSLAHIYVKELIYFCSHDSNALRLVEHTERLGTNLESLLTIKLYEMIYYLCKMRMAGRKEMRYLYKFSYYLTDKEKRDNPGWDNFMNEMDLLYDKAVKHSTGKPVPLIKPPA